VWAEPTTLALKRFSVSTASAEGARCAAVIGKHGFVWGCCGMQQPLVFCDNERGAGASGPCRVWAEPTTLALKRFSVSTASAEGARCAAVIGKHGFVWGCYEMSSPLFL